MISDVGNQHLFAVQGGIVQGLWHAFLQEHVNVGLRGQVIDIGQSCDLFFG